MDDFKPVVSIDSLLPSEMAFKAEGIGLKKIQMDPLKLFTLAVLAGAFIAMGAIFSTTVVTGAKASLPFGVTRLLAGLTFSTGLILVIVGGAELFTGNNLIVMAWASRKVTTAQLLWNWLIVYVGNFTGSVATALIVVLSGQYKFNNGSLGLTALDIAHAKVNLSFSEAFFLGILCNALVCLAVWMTFSARSTTDKILVIVPPITAFVAAGFEHSIANMYFMPVAIFIRQWAPATFWDSAGVVPTEYNGLNWGEFINTNLIPVTLGNIFGGAVMVGVVYWFIYLRSRQSDSSSKQNDH